MIKDTDIVIPEMKLLSADDAKFFAFIRRFYIPGFLSEALNKFIEDDSRYQERRDVDWMPTNDTVLARIKSVLAANGATVFDVFGKTMQESYAIASLYSFFCSFGILAYLYFKHDIWLRDERCQGGFVKNDATIGTLKAFTSCFFPSLLSAKENQTCKHEWVNVSFNGLVMACKHCGADAPKA